MLGYTSFFFAYMGWQAVCPRAEHSSSELCPLLNVHLLIHTEPQRSWMLSYRREHLLRCWMKSSSQSPSPGADFHEWTLCAGRLRFYEQNCNSLKSLKMPKDHPSPIHDCYYPYKRERKKKKKKEMLCCYPFAKERRWVYYVSLKCRVSS